MAQGKPRRIGFHSLKAQVGAQPRRQPRRADGAPPKAAASATPKRAAPECVPFARLGRAGGLPQVFAAVRAATVAFTAKVAAAAGTGRVTAACFFFVSGKLYQLANAVGD